jgi:hypothetical protein
MIKLISKKMQYKFILSGTMWIYSASHDTFSVYHFSVFDKGHMIYSNFIV